MDISNFVEIEFRSTGPVERIGVITTIDANGNATKRFVRNTPMGIFRKDTGELIYEEKQVIRSWGKIV